MLEIETMAFRNLAIDSLFDPGYFINELVAKGFEKFKSVAVLGIDYPYEHEAISLKLFERHFVHDLGVCKSFVSDGNSTGWISGRQLPWRVDGYDIK
jgi:hypothetical protein